METIEETSGNSDSKDEREEGSRQEWNASGFTFEADALEGQRVLESDEVIRFKTSLLDTDSPDAVLSGIEGSVQSGGFQFQNAHRIRKKIKQIIQKNLKKDNMMSHEEATQVI